ncbi:MAG: hypothetical protein V4547_17170 [Bacteroidota bacterium]
MEKTKTAEEIITDEEITKVWQNANFGDTPKRGVILEAIKHVAQGWSNGSTATAIIKELGLVDFRNGHYGLSDKGLEYLLTTTHQFTSEESEGIVKKLEEALNPQYMNDSFTWNKIEKSLLSILNTKS